MTMKSLMNDIRRYGAAKLDEYGLEVTGSKSDEPGQYDDEILFRNKAGRILAVRLQVPTFFGDGWGAAAVNRMIYEEKPVGRSGFKHHTLHGLIGPVFLFNNAKKSVDRIMEEIEKSGLIVEPVDDLEAKIVTDFRMSAIITGLEQVEEMLAGVTEIRFSGDNSHITGAALYCDDVEFVRAEIHGEYEVAVKNSLQGSDKTVAGNDNIKEAIKDLALASYSSGPSL